MAITGLLGSDDSDQENVPSLPSASPLPDLSGANSPGPDAPQPVPPPLPVPPPVQPVPVPPLAAQAQQPRPVDMIGIMQASGGPGM